MLQGILMSAYAALHVPQLLAVFAAVIVVVLATCASSRHWVHAVVAVLLFLAIATASIWILQLGWALALAGLLATICGLIWRTVGSNAQTTGGHGSGGLIWPGIGLIAAPIANVFVLMPMLRQVVH